MRIIELDGTNWASGLDFYEALLSALGAHKGHGRNINALLDSMIWTDKVNTLVPPYEIVVTNVAHLPQDALREIELLKTFLKRAREDHRLLRGTDVQVEFTIR
jgi:RNAse (barnase) inhibitor barstar